MKFDYALNWDRQSRYRPRKVPIDIEGVDSADHIIRRIRQTGTFYEIELLNYLLVRGPLGGVYIDIGANIGNHTVFFAKFLADHVVCVEPSPRIGKVLKRNLEANAIANYSLVDCALGAESASGRIRYPDNDNIGMTRVVQDETDAGQVMEQVDIRTLDDVMRSLHLKSPISLVKIDVEGMELEVLKGAHRILETDRPQLIVEAATDNEQSRLFSFLKPYGYEPRAQFCATPTFHMIIPGVHRLRDTTLFYRAVRLLRRVQRAMA